METNKQNEHNAANDGLLLPPLDDDMINTAWDIPTLTFSDISDIDRKPAVSPMSAVPQPVTTTPQPTQPPVPQPPVPQLPAASQPPRPSAASITLPVMQPIPSASEASPQVKQVNKNHRNPSPMTAMRAPR